MPWQRSSSLLLALFSFHPPKNCSEVLSLFLLFISPIFSFFSDFFSWSLLLTSFFPFARLTFYSFCLDSSPYKKKKKYLSCSSGTFEAPKQSANSRILTHGNGKEGKKKKTIETSLPFLFGFLVFHFCRSAVIFIQTAWGKAVAFAILFFFFFYYFGVDFFSFLLLFNFS